MPQIKQKGIATHFNDENGILAHIDYFPAKWGENGIEDRIRHELGDAFVEIARCESGLRQFNDNGTVLISRTSDKGLFQINQVHWDAAERLGIDLDTVDGNIAYAKLLKERNGTRDWLMSAHCWRS